MPFGSVAVADDVAAELVDRTRVDEKVAVNAAEAVAAEDKAVEDAEKDWEARAVEVAVTLPEVESADETEAETVAVKAAVADADSDPHTASAVSVQGTTRDCIEVEQIEHREHVLLALALAYLPAAQAVHMDSWDAPAMELYVPMPHAVHASARTRVE